VVLLFCCLNLAMHLLVGRVPDIEEATYALLALSELDRWTGGNRVDLNMFAAALNTRFYTPLYIHMLALTYWGLGVEQVLVLVPNMALGAMALVSVHRATLALGGTRWDGLTAALLLACFPGFLQASAGSYVDYAMACWSAVAFYFFAAYRGSLIRFTWVQAGYLVGLSLAIACGLMSRWSFALLPVSLFLPDLVRTLWRRALDGKNLLRRHLLPYLAALAGALPLLHWLLTVADIERLRDTPGSEDSGLTYGESLVYYLDVLGPQGMGLALTVIGAGLLAASLRPLLRSYGTGPLVCWLAVCLLFFAAILRKKEIYVLYAYPALSLLTVHALVSLPWRRMRALARGALVVAALATAVTHVATLPPQSPRFYREVIRQVERSWDGERPARLLIHTGEPTASSAYSWLTFAFENAASRGTPKVFYRIHDSQQQAGIDFCKLGPKGADFLLLGLNPAPGGGPGRDEQAVVGCPLWRRAAPTYDLARLGHLRGEAALFRAVKRKPAPGRR